ncbi:MAG: lipase/acyltransferase domain-containing protein [Pseudonocardia sp.]
MSGMSSRPGPNARTVRPNVSQDAVLVIPGIMGSTLRDTASGMTLWGFDRLRSYARMWCRSQSSLATLMVTDDEREGRYGRIAATGLLKFPAYAPFLHGFEPYTTLLRRLRDVVADPAAIGEFAYDWRLPVEYNARLLASAARAHLDGWRAHPGHHEMLRQRPHLRPARMVLVAHSMGGLLVRGLPPDSDLDIRAIVTLGTPFDGAAKAALMLNSGCDAPIPLPRRQLRDLAATLPGVHDLLPAYRCLDDGEHDPRRLTPTDVAAIGGDATLAAASFDLHRRTSTRPLAGHHAVIGTSQSTVQSLSLRDGILTGRLHTFALDPAGDVERDQHGILVRFDDFGDGTVPRNSATLGSPATLPQQHGALAQTSEAIETVCNVITERATDAPRLGDSELGLDVPDVVTPGREWAAAVTGVEGPNDASCVVSDEQGRPIDHPPLHRRDGVWQATIVLPEPGIYRVILNGGGTSAITNL